MQGQVRLNDTLLLGPTSVGEFVPVTIRGIQRKRLPVDQVRGGQTASFALKKVSLRLLRRVMADLALYVAHHLPHSFISK